MPVDDGLHTRIQRNTQILQEARYNLPTWRPRSGHTSAHLQRAARLSCYRVLNVYCFSFVSRAPFLVPGARHAL